MVATATLLVFAAIVGLVAVSAFFSSTEIAIFSLPIDRVRALGETAAGRRLGQLRGNPHRLLVTLLVGNTLVNMAVASLATVLAIQTLPPNVAVPVATVGAAGVVLVFGEILPKSWGLGNAEPWSLRAAPIVHAIELALYPLVSVFDWLTRRFAATTSAKAEIEELVLDD